MGRTELLLGWRSPLCLSPLAESLDRHRVSALRPSVLQRKQVIYIQYITQFDDESLSPHYACLRNQPAQPPIQN